MNLSKPIIGALYGNQLQHILNFLDFSGDFLVFSTYFLGEFYDFKLSTFFFFLLFFLQCCKKSESRELKRLRQSASARF